MGCPLRSLWFLATALHAQNIPILRYYDGIVKDVIDAGVPVILQRYACFRPKQAHLAAHRRRIALDDRLQQPVFSTPADAWPSMGTWDAEAMRAQFPRTERFHFEVRSGICHLSLFPGSKRP